jgi:hypothetical protein
MQTDPNEIQKLTERVEAIEKQIFEWKIIYEQQKRGSVIGFALFALVVLVIALTWR